MKKLSLLYAFIFALSVSACAQKQPEKQEIFKKVWKAVGGKATFEKSRYLEFTFAPIRQGKQTPGRHHIWDRYTGDYRLDYTAENGKQNIILFNVNTKQGKAYNDGLIVADSVASGLIKNAYAAFINDSYWLMSPLKLQDEGVNTQIYENTDVNGVNCNVIHLNFDKVGLTPGDQYWMYVNNETGEIVRWKFLLQNQKNAAIFDWEPYQDLGNGLRLSVKKNNKENNISIYFPVAKVLQSVGETTFYKP